MSEQETEKPELEIKAKWNGPQFLKEWRGKKCCNSSSNSGGGSMIYFVGFVGALVYYMQAAGGFVPVVTGFLKSLVWPAYLVYNALEKFYGAAGG